DGIRDYKVTGVQTCALPIYKISDKNRIASTRQPQLDRQQLKKILDTARAGRPAPPVQQQQPQPMAQSAPPPQQPAQQQQPEPPRSEERRVGKEGRTRRTKRE